MKRLLRLTRSPWLLVPLTVVILYTATGYLAIPFLIEHYAPKLAAEQINRQLSLGEVRLDPFRLTLEIKDFALKEANGEPLAAFARLFTDLELESITNRAVTLAEITLEHPVIHAVLDKEGRLNFAKIADALPPSEEPAPPAAEPLPLVIEHTTLIDGTIEFIDQSRSNPINETIDAINLEIDTLSTLPDTAGSHHIKAQFADGSSLDWQGKIGLNPIQSDGAIRIEGFKLATPWDFVREQVALNPPGGQLDVATQYRFQKTRDQVVLGLTSIAVTLSGLQLVPSDTKEPILALDTINMKDGEFDLSERTVKIPAFTIQKGRIRAEVDRRGEINWQKLAKPAGPTKAPAVGATPAQSPTGHAEPPWQIEVAGFKIAEIGIQVTDASRRSAIELDVGKFGLGFRANIEAGTGEPKVVVDGLGADLAGIQMKELSRQANLVTLDTLSLKEGRLDLASHEITLGQVALTGGGTVIERDEKGAIRLVEALSAGDPGELRKIIKTVKVEAEQQGKPWSIAVKQATVQGFRTAITDRSVSPALVYGLRDIDLKVNDVVNDGKTPITFAAKLNIEQGGSLSAGGTASQKGDRADADIRVDRFELKGLQAFVARAGALRLDKGDVSTRMHVSFQQGAHGPSLKAKGEITSTNLLLNEVASRKRFLSWKNLTVEGIDFGLEPNKLMIKEIHVTEPGTNFEIFEDKTTNVAAIFGNQKAPGAQKRTTVLAPKALPETEKGRKNPPAKTFPVSVQRVKIDDATVDFSDQSLIFPFQTRIQNFDGHVSGISTSPSGRTLLQFEGRVDEYGEASLEGQLELMRFKAFSDITLLFRNVDMSSLSPYSGTFAGRRIRSGKLNVDLLYRIEQSRLKSHGKIVLENLALGEQVESPKAKSLPLDLAIALLTDSQGKITVSMPIEGDVDSPTFVYGQVLWDAIVTVLTKAVTAPFAALGGVFGGGEANMAEIFFVPGNDALPPPEREKLKKVADALAQRPMVTVTVQGGFDPKLDTEALKSRQVRTVITEKLGITLLPGEDPGPIAVNSAKTQKALEELAAEQGAGGAADEARAAFRKAAGREPKRIGALSNWLDKASEDAEFYQLLFDRLVANAPLSPKLLETLSDQRGQAIVKELTTRGSLARSRVRIGKSAAVTGSEGRIPAKLDLGATGT